MYIYDNFLIKFLKDKPLIWIKQLTPKFDDSSEDDEVRAAKEMKRLKKTVIK